MDSSVIPSKTRPVALPTLNLTFPRRNVISKLRPITRPRVIRTIRKRAVITLAKLVSRDSPVVESNEVVVEEACCDCGDRKLTDPFEHSASIARGLMLVRPTVLLRRFTTRGMASRPPTFMAVMMTAFLYLYMSIREAIKTKVRSCEHCHGFGITRCDLCEGHRVVSWEGKYKHLQPCPKCFGKRYVRCCKCGGFFGRSIFNHQTRESLGVKELSRIEQELNIDESWIGAPKWVV